MSCFHKDFRLRPSAESLLKNHWFIHDSNPPQFVKRPKEYPVGHSIRFQDYTEINQEDYSDLIFESNTILNRSVDQQVVEIILDEAVDGIVFLLIN
jgi:hypothetical protein